MSNALTVLRDSIVTALKAEGVHAFTVVPEALTPPATFVGPGDPYITTDGANFGGEIVRHQVTIVAASGVNAVRAESLDAQTLTVLDVLYALPDVTVVEVDRPGSISINGQAHLAVAIDVTTAIYR